MSKNIALIPARGGSKRLPNKNIKPINNKPLIAYSIEAALATKKIDRTIVSTDCQEIAQIARQYGAEVPFIRPDNISQDSTSDRPVMLHAIDTLLGQGYSFDNLIYLRPTTPLKTSCMIDEAINKLETDDYTGIRSVTTAHAVFHPYWMFKAQQGTLKPFIDGIDISQYYQSQLLPSCYRLNGVVDASRTSTIQQCDNIYGSNVGYIEIDEESSIDIDTKFEFKMCEIVLQQREQANDL